MAANIAAPPLGTVTVAPATTQGDVNTLRKRYTSIMYRLGIAEVCLGSACIVLGIIGVIFAATITGSVWYYHFIGLTYIAPGIWCGIFPIISGSLGICSRNKPTSQMFNSNMGMSIVSSCFMMILFIMSIMSAAVDQYAFLTVLHILLLMMSFALFIINIIHSVYCCAGTCCYSGQPPTQIVYTSTQPAYFAQQPHTVQLANGQYMLVQNPAMVNYPVMQGAPMHLAWQPTHVNQPLMGQPPLPAQSKQVPGAQSHQGEAGTAPPGYDVQNFAVNPNYQ